MDKNTRHARSRQRTRVNVQICKFGDIKVTFSLHAVCDLHLLARAEALRLSGAFGLRVMVVGEAVAVLHRAGIHNRRVRDGTGLLVRRIRHFLLLKLGSYSFESGVLKRFKKKEVEITPVRGAQQPSSHRSAERRGE